MYWLKKQEKQKQKSEAILILTLIMEQLKVEQGNLLPINCIPKVLLSAKLNSPE